MKLSFRYFDKILGLMKDFDIDSPLLFSHYLIFFFTLASFAQLQATINYNVYHFLQ